MCYSSEVGRANAPEVMENLTKGDADSAYRNSVPSRGVYLLSAPQFALGNLAYFSFTIGHIGNRAVLFACLMSQAVDTESFTGRKG